MATIKDVAKRAGVSIASVSRYFNNQALLSADKCAAIEDAVQELNYSPSSFGRGLRLSRSGKVLVLLPTMSNPIYQKVLSSIEEESIHYGITVLTCATNNDPYTERHLLQMLQNHYVDGAIFFASSLPAAELNALSRRYPLVQCIEFVRGAQLPSVSVDNQIAACDAVEHLIACGHERIAMISGQRHYGSTVEREEGYHDALRHHGIAARKEYLVNTMYGYHSGMKAAAELLALPEPPTAIFAVSDAIAIGAVKEALNRGMRVGKNGLAVVGFDDSTIASMYTPTLTSVHQPRGQMGKMAVELFMHRAETLRSSEPVRQVILPHTLIRRQSTT